tara:strand:- start:86 stop:649 length:564 start_codon:yes stop_codon:yes gene_type:complete
MALSNAAYSAVHDKTSSDLTKLETKFNEGHHLILTDMADDAPHLAALVYQIQKMQDELTYLRTEISTNKDKTGITTSQANAITANTAKTTFPGLGTSSTTALAGDTTTISTAQANEITASTTLGTKLNVVTRVADANKSTAITFGEFTTVTGGKGGTTYSLPITVVETDTSGKSPVTTTKTTTLTLT